MEEGAAFTLGDALGQIEQEEPDGLPRAEDAERTVLSGILLDPTTMDQAIDSGLSAADFYNRRNGQIFGAMLALWSAGSPVGTVSVCDELLRRGLLDRIGGASAIGRLEGLIPSAALVPFSAKIVKDKAGLREMISLARLMQSDCMRQSQPPRDIAAKVSEALNSIGTDGGSEAVRHIKEYVTEAVNQAEEAEELRKSGKTVGVPGGLRDVDRLTLGYQPGEISLIAARPGAGKSAYAFGCAQAAAASGVGVGLFSLEMGGSQLAMRMISGRSGVDLSRMRGGTLEDHEWPLLASAAGAVEKLPIWIDDRPIQSPDSIRSQIRSMVREHNIGLAMIDYIGLMDGPKGYSNKVVEVAEISKGLKQTAREFNIPMVVLSQLSRKVEERSDKRPIMSDLRDSGALEQDAFLIQFLYRAEYYLKEKTPDDRKGIAEIIIAKHRNGPTGKVDVRFDAETASFRDL